MKKFFLTALIVSTTVIFMGCSGPADKDLTVSINDSSIEDNFEYPDNSTIKEFGEIADGNFEINIDDESNEISNESMSYDSKSISFDGLTVDIPSNWETVDYDDSLIYVFEDGNCIVSFVSETMYGLSADEYMSLALTSVKKDLGVNMIFTESKTINNVQVDTFEYTQDLNGMPVYTYQPTIFKDGTAYILTIASIDSDLLNSYKDLSCDIISKAR